MESAEIRRRFLGFFREREHAVIPSASLIATDPTLLFVNAGMVPFKPYFLGEAPAPWPRATSVQKVVRTLDIDEVGRTTRHASFFQMCGNFSFGDYFKEGAIGLAWELLTKSVGEGGFGFPEDRLWVTVYEDDDESIGLWRRVAGLPAERIQRRGMADNFWSMGVPGPCGPCSEIYYDRGPRFGREGGPVADEDRYLEVWNLVFMQQIRGEGPGKEGYPILGDLPARNIDTGAGLERLAAVLQGVDNIYEIDTTRAVLDRAAEITGKSYGRSEPDDVALRVVADHIRTCVFLVGDGVRPGNEGRGYVLRRLARRVIHHMRILGAEEPTMDGLVSSVVDSMSPQYPELIAEHEHIRQALVGEEKLFLSTLRSGLNRFEAAADATRSRQSRLITGSEAFSLHDTYGFPIELTLEMASDQGLEVDRDGFADLMRQQRDRAKADARARKAGHTSTTVYRDVMADAGTTTFTGYDQVSGEATLRALVREGAVVPSAAEGDMVEVILDRTPFYSEGGGQQADTGRIVLPDGSELEVLDVQSPVPGLSVHRARVVAGEPTVGERALAEVDLGRRRAISRAHTATHMLHKAIREELGEGARQLGSENAPGRLRFDFPSAGPVPRGQLGEVEARVNEMLAEDLPVSSRVMPLTEARELGAVALFGEKYGDEVRVISVGDWSRELCGGTHVNRSGEIGLVSVVSEGSVGAGVRRVEALVGRDAYDFLAREHLIVHRVSELVKARADDLPERIEALMVKLKETERELKRLRAEQLTADIDKVIGQATDFGDFRLWTFRAPSGTTSAQLRDLVLRAGAMARPELKVAFVGAAVEDGRVSLVATVNPTGRQAGLSARELLQAALPGVSGRGGGKDDVAQGGGTDPEGLPAAFAAVVEFVRERAER